MAQQTKISENIDLKDNFAVIQEGGSIGESGISDGRGNKVIQTFPNAESAKQFAKDRRKLRSQGEKQYFKISYKKIDLNESIREMMLQSAKHKGFI